MNELIEKLIGRLEELYNNNDKMKKKAYEERDWENFELFTHGNEGVKESIEIVNQLAEEYGKDNNVSTIGWIPCNDRLPEEGTFVLLQDYNENITLEYCKTHGGIKGFDDGDWWSGANKYLAWCPLPDPYIPNKE